MKGDTNARYKIPGRQVWCYSIPSWLRNMVRIYVVLPLSR